MNLREHERRYLIKILSYAKGGMEITKEEASKGLGFLSPRKATTKAKAFKRARSARKAAKSEKYRQSTKEIRAVCMERADGRCEACGFGLEQNGGAQLDHWESGSGRRRERQSTWNCWILCATCHWKRTDNIPDVKHWNITFGRHCGFWGYTFTPHVEHAKVPAPQAHKPDPGQTHYQGDSCPGGHLVEVDPPAP